MVYLLCNYLFQSHMEDLNKGFILLGKLIFISAMMITVSLNGARTKAYDASFKAAASSLLPEAILCCDNGGILQGNSDGSICVGEKNEYGMDYSEIGSIQILQNCEEKTGNFRFEVIPSAEIGGSVSKAVCTANGCDFE